MKKSNLISGGILISIGVLFLLLNAGLISWSIVEIIWWSMVDSTRYLWPLILIVVGINTIFQNNKIIRIIAWTFLIVAFILYPIFLKGNDVGRNGQSIASKNEYISLDKPEETKYGDLSLTIAGAKVNINSEDEKLIEGNLEGEKIQYNLDYEDNYQSAKIKIENPKTQWKNSINKNNRYNINLNKDVLWNLDLEMGAVSGKFDFSDLLVKDLDLKTGAGDIEVIFSDKYNDVDVEIDAGAGNLLLMIPEDLGINMKVKGGISRTNVKGLNLIKNDGIYRSSNYEDAAKKIDLTIKMGVGNLEVKAR